jgi:23S rRNA pseudouridine2605 synthase
MTDQQRPDATKPDLIDALENEIEDPIGDLTDGEAATALDPQTSIGAEKEAEIELVEEASLDKPEFIEGAEAAGETKGSSESEDEDDEPEFKPKSRPPAKLERLQKILAAAGVASRRKAEEMIEQGRVQLNGKVVTELGTKADAGRDHIRVDGKLLQGAERLRYFVLNKPRGFVTTVKDPEGRPTVMQFFDKMRERLYPVGRLDYMSEGLLLVTNDGELANKLTRASAGVEKTYLVKVAGIPSEDELDILRAGVAIEKGKPGSGKVRTSPARIRQVRQGDNPWFEVVLIEGRNRELRKMFEEVGHFVEKIRRVGYGPLILDQEPGNLRELDAEELELLRKVADGKLKTPKAKQIRRRNMIDSLPPEKPAFRPRGLKPAAGPKDYKPKRAFGTERPVRTGQGNSGPSKFAAGPAKSGPGKFGTPRSEPPPPQFGPSDRRAWKKDDQAARPPTRFVRGSGAEQRASASRSYGERPPAGRSFGAKPPAGRTFGNKPAGRTYPPKPGVRSIGDKPDAGRKFSPGPAWKKPEGKRWPASKRPSTTRPEATRRPAPEPIEDLGPRKPSRLHIEPVHASERPDRSGSDRRGSDRTRPERTGPERTGSDRTRPERTGFDRTSSERPRPQQTRPADRPSFNRPPSGRPEPGHSGFGHSGAPRPGGGRTSSTRPGTNRPFRAEGGLARPFTTSSGKPRPGGARPSSKPGKDSGRSSGSGSERRTGSGWKPRPGGFSKSGSDRSGSKGPGPRSKPTGPGGKRSGPRPGGKLP